MHILYFHQHFSTPKGSTGIRSYTMARAAVEAGHQVTMVCGSYNGGETGLTSPFIRGRREGKVDGIHIIEFDLAYSNADGFFKRSLQFLRFAFRSVGIALFKKYDVLFATTTPLTAGIPGIFARWLRNKPFVFEVRDLWPELPREMGVITNPVVLGLMSMLEWMSYRSATRCIGLAPGIVAGIERRGVLPERIAMIPNGCDINLFGQVSDSWAPSEIGDTDFLAVFTGTHGIANGLAAVLDAAAELQVRKRSDIRILLVGQGRCKSELQERANKLGLDNVHFHDPVNKQKLAALFNRADIGLQILANVPAFYYGTSPNKFFDYIAAGLPVINNYPGWLAELIQSKKVGFAVPPADPKALADALESLADDRQQLKEFSENARSLAESEFDRAALAKKWLAWVTDGQVLDTIND